MLVALIATVSGSGACRLAAADDSAAQPADNPLWAISLDALNATRERPIFDPSRRPPPLALPAPVAQPIAAAPREDLKPLRLTLLGTVIGGETQLALCQDQTTKETIRLKTGQNHEGWILRAVSRREAQFEKADQIATLVFPVPGTETQDGDAPRTKSMIAGVVSSPVSGRKHHRR